MTKQIRTHSDLIDALGGTAAVARLCKVGMSAVSNWRQEGIAERHHYRLSEAAKSAEITLPPNFFDEAPASSPQAAA